MSTIVDDLDSCLRDRFGLDRFRPGQREVIEAVLSRRDCLCVMPTGGGKSLCYQLPSLILDGVTLVISPLIALMKDQVDGLLSRGIRATLVNSMVDTATQNERIAAMERGEYDLVYIAPERFRSARFSEAIARTRVALLAVDEAHCISEWGHDFRPDYTRIGRARRKLGLPPTIALTATATDNVRRDICEQLELTDPRVFVTGFDRPNLRYEVRYASSDAAKQQAIAGLLNQVRGPGIIYCSSRKRCDEVADFLRTDMKRKAIVYHAGLAPDDRRRAQETFMGGKELIVVATNAFGMGVDKPDIRFVVHYNMPGTVEAYYQEAGRAGRDGVESICLMLYAPGDRHIQEFFIESEYPSRQVVWSIYEFLSRQPQDPIEMTQEQIKERLRLEISEMGVGASLKLLESGGVLERLRPRENMAIVRIENDMSLVGLLPQNATIQRRVLSALERLVAATQGDDTYFSPHLLAQRLELDSNQFSRALYELCEKLPMHYVPPFRGNAVRMIQRGVPFDQIGIDFEKLEDRKKREFEKLDRVIDYAQSRTCRRRVILAYFGDQSPVQCGHCDNCGSSVQTERHDVLANDRVRDIVRKILSGVARATRGRLGFGKRLIAAMLVGKNLKSVKRWKLDQLSTFGLLKDFDADEVALLIDSLIATGWIELEQADRFKPVVRLTAAGREVMIGERDASCAWLVPAELLAKLQGNSRSKEKKRRLQNDATPDRSPPDQELDPSDALADDPAIADDPEQPLDRDLLRVLKEQRDRWAAESNVPAYMILSNRTLDGLARAKPESIAGMLKVKGMGPAKIARFGEKLLQLMHGPTRPNLAEPDAVPDRARSDEPHRLPRSKRLPVLTQFFDVNRVPAQALTAHEPVEVAKTSGPASHYWTWRLLDRGFTQSECALIRDKDEEAILDDAIQAAREGRRVPIEAFLPDDLIHRLATLTFSETGQLLTSLPDDWPDDVTSKHVELYALILKIRRQQYKSLPGPVE